MADQLNPKQQRFIDEYLADSNATQAAIRSGYSSKTAAQIGNRLLRNVQICSELSRRQAAISERADVSLEQHLRDLKRIRDAALEAGQYSAAATAEHHRGKASGLYVDRGEIAVEMVETLAVRRRAA